MWIWLLLVESFDVIAMAIASESGQVCLGSLLAFLRHCKDTDVISVYVAHLLDEAFAWLRHVKVMAHIHLGR